MAFNQSELQPTSKRLIRGISFQHKLAILRQLEAGIPRKAICENLQCCQSTITRVLTTKDAILELADKEKHLLQRPLGIATYKDIDDGLSKWAQEMKRNNKMISSGMAKQKAEEIAKAMGEDGFLPSAGWLYKWKERENVKFCKKSQILGEQSLDASSNGEEILKGLLEKKESQDEQEEEKDEEHANDNKRMKMVEDFMSNKESNATDKNTTFLEDNKNREQNLRALQNFIRLSQRDEIQSQELNKNQSQSDKQIPQLISAQTFYKNVTANMRNASAPADLLIPAKSDYQSSALRSFSSTPVLPGSSQQTLATSPKKVFYSYDPVYVLTSSGRFRKAKTFLTLLQKLEILQRLKNGEKRTDLINEYRLSQSAMCQIIADESKINRMAAIGQNLQMKRVRGGIFKGGEAELNAWVLQKMHNGETLTRNEVKHKAREIAERMNLEFKASTGWLEKWKTRMNMDFNENQILYRKHPLYMSKNEEMATNVLHNRERKEFGDDYDEDDEEEHSTPQHRLSNQTELDPIQDYHMQYSGDNSLDIKHFADGHEQFYPEVNTVLDDEVEDVKPFAKNPPDVLPINDCSSDSSSDEQQQSPLHQQVISWLNKYNIAPTAGTELLTILHPVISDNPNAPHQTRLTITTKPASSTKGRPYAQHTYF